MRNYLLVITFICISFYALAKNSATTKWRVKATCNSYYNTTSSSFVVSDSTIYFYSGLRSGAMVAATTAGWQYAGKYDSSYMQMYSATTMTLEPYMKTWQVFDSHDNLLAITSKQYDATNGWINYQLFTYTYDSSNNMLSSLQQYWDAGSSSWQNNQHTMYSYNAANDLISDTTDAWYLSSSWLHGESNEYTYDTSHHLQTRITANWNISSGLWQYSIKYSYYLRSSTYVIDSLVRGVYNNSIGGWTPNTKESYTYDLSNNMLADTTLIWTGAIWRNSTMKSYNYTGTDQTGETDLTWNTGMSAWVNSAQYASTFNTSHNITSKILRTVSGGSFVNATKDSETYNTNKLITQYNNYGWSTGIWQAVAGDQHDNYYYESYVDATNVAVPENKASLSLYPCPATDAITLELKWQQPQEATLVIYDMAGRQWRKWHLDKTATYRGTIPVNMLPPGNYILSVESNGEQIARQFSIVR
jgi:hypothetical protein